MNFKKNPIEKKSFFLVEKYFQKKVEKKSENFRFFFNFFFENIFRSEKIVFFDRIFFKSYLLVEDNRFETVLKRSRGL